MAAAAGSLPKDLFFSIRSLTSISQTANFALEVFFSSLLLFLLPLREAARGRGSLVKKEGGGGGQKLEFGRKNCFCAARCVVWHFGTIFPKTTKRTRQETEKWKYRVLSYPPFLSALETRAWVGAAGWQKKKWKRKRRRNENVTENISQIRSQERCNKWWRGFKKKGREKNSTAVDLECSFFSPPFPGTELQK